MTGTRTLRSNLLRYLKFFGIATLVVLVLFGIASLLVFRNKNDLVLHEIQRFVNESQSGQLHIESIDFKPFRSFPDITIELKGISYYEHKDSVRAESEKSILRAEHLFVAIELVPLLNDQLKISEVSLSRAQLDIVEYDDDKLNIELALATPGRSKIPTVQDTTKVAARSKPVTGTKAHTPVTKPSGSSVEIDLDFLSLDELHVTWLSNDNSPPNIVIVENLTADLMGSGNLLNAEISSQTHLQSVHIGKVHLPAETLTLDGLLQYDLIKKLLTVQQGDVTFDEFSATFAGTLSMLANTILDVGFDASSNDLELLSLVIKPEVLRQNPDLLQTGDIYIKGKIAGNVKHPLIDISFGIKDINLRLPDNLGNFNDVAFEGSFSSGNKPNYSEATLSIDKIEGQLPGGPLRGSFRLHDFVNPHLKYKLDAELNIDGYDKVFNIPAVKELTGSVTVHANFDGSLKLFAEHQSDSTRSSVISLENVSFIVVKTNKLVSALSGVVENKYNTATLKDVTLNYGANDLTLNATIDNLAYFLFGRSTEIVASGTLKSSQLHTHDLLFDSLADAHIQDRISNLSIDFLVKTSAQDSSELIPVIQFSIPKLTADFDKLPDLKSLAAIGTFRDTENGLELTLREFNALLPAARLDVTGELLIRNKRLWEFDANLTTENFPVFYVEELIREIRSHDAGRMTKTPEQMDLVTTQLDLSAQIVTYPFDVTKLTVRDTKATVQLANATSFSTEKLNINCDDLSFIHKENSSIITGLKSTTGTISFDKLTVPKLGTMDLSLVIAGKDDSVNIDFSRMAQQAKREDGTLTIDFSKKEHTYTFDYLVRGASLDKHIKKFYKKDLLKGYVDYDLNLTASGSTIDSITQTMAGTVEVNGDSIDLYGIDVDNILRKFERSQNFNLTDLGAVLVAGPIGLAVTKGTDFASLAAVELKAGHKTHIQSLKTKWVLRDLQLTTVDVAFSTPENRIALMGSIDIAKDSIPGLTIAVVDKQGCSLMEQQMHGKLSALHTGELKIAKTLFGSVINFVNNVVGKDCKPIYTGSVAAPTDQ